MSALRACGHAVPPTAVVCPVCGAVAGASSATSRPSPPRRRSSVAVILALLAIVVGAGAIAFLVTRSEASGPARIVGSLAGKPASDGPTWTRESIPWNEPYNLNSVREEVNPIPAADAKRYRITDPKSGISFAPIVRVAAAGERRCSGSSPATCIFRRQEWKAEPLDSYWEWVHLIPYKAGLTDDSVLHEDYWIDETPLDGQFTATRRVTVDGHPGTEALAVYESYEQSQGVVTVTVVPTKAGYLRIVIGMLRKHGEGAAPTEPFLGTFRIP